MTRLYGKIALVAALLGTAMTSAGCASESYDRAPGPDRPYASNDYSNDPHYASYQYYADQCGQQKHDRNVAGTVIGAVAGGLLGNAVSRGGGKTGGTIIGAAAGAAVGSNIARSSFHCNAGRPYWTSEQTMDYDRYPGYAGRHDTGWYRSHDCRWVHGDRDDYIRVCRGDNDYYYPEY